MYFIFRQLKSDKGIEGTWQGKLRCNNGFVNGVEIKIGGWRDGATNIAMHCGIQRMSMKM